MENVFSPSQHKQIHKLSQQQCRAPGWRGAALQGVGKTRRHISVLMYNKVSDPAMSLSQGLLALLYTHNTASIAPMYKYSLYCTTLPLLNVWLLFNCAKVSCMFRTNVRFYYAHINMTKTNVVITLPTLSIVNYLFIVKDEFTYVYFANQRESGNEN